MKKKMISVCLLSACMAVTCTGNAASLTDDMTMISDEIAIIDDGGDVPAVDLPVDSDSAEEDIPEADDGMADDGAADGRTEDNGNEGTSAPDDAQDPSPAGTDTGSTPRQDPSPEMQDDSCPQDYEEEYDGPEDDGGEEDGDMEEDDGDYEYIRNSDEVYSIDDFDLCGIEEAQADFDLPAIRDIPMFHYLEVPELLQNPELPTGCESIALTMALMYEGFDLEKETIAREFLIRNREDDNMAIGYIGDPFSDDGAGCFAPAIAATAKCFFEDQELDYEAYDITGTEMETLLCYVAADTPVVLWTTMYMAEPEFTDERGKYDGKTYKWYRQEHCVVLSGYDLSDRTVQVNDPLEGIVTRKFEDFKRIYDETGKYAVVVRNME